MGAWALQVFAASLFGYLAGLLAVWFYQKGLDGKESKVVHELPSQLHSGSWASGAALSANGGLVEEFQELREISKKLSAYSLNSNRDTAVSNVTYWETDMATCPRGVKVLMLGVSGVATLGQYNGDKFFVGWYPLPRKRV
jgi:hypothetical protein